MNYQFKIEIEFRNGTKKVFDGVNGHFVDGITFGVVDGNKKHIYPLDTIQEIHVTDNTVYPVREVM